MARNRRKRCASCGKASRCECAGKLAAAQRLRRQDRQTMPPPDPPDWDDHLNTLTERAARGEELFPGGDT